MRIYDAPPAQARRAEATALMARLAEAGRRVRRKPRSAEQQAVLIRMAAGGLRRRIASGRLVQTGPRSWGMVLLSDRPTAPPAPQPPRTHEGADR